MSSQAMRRPARERGIYVPADEVEAHLANGWRLIEDCLGTDAALLAAPELKERIDRWWHGPRHRDHRRDLPRRI